MSDLRDPLDDLLADVPTYVVPDARAAWAAGARRRTRHRLGVVAAACLAVALVAGAIAWLPSRIEPHPADGGGVEGYPARVLAPVLARGLPDAPGPLAVVYRRNGEDASGWWAADSRGRTWAVPQRDMIDDYPPALSPDGRMIGYLADPTTYVIRDLVTGDETSFDSITDGLESRRAQGDWVLSSQNPAFWSPDGTRLLVRGSGDRTPRTTAMLLGVDGSVSALETPGFPAGWVDDDTLAFVLDGSSYLAEAPAELILVGTDGVIERKSRLRLPFTDSVWLSQWSSSVSPDGTTLAIAADRDLLYLLTTAGGSRLGRMPITTNDTCLTSWRGSEPAVAGVGILATVSGDVITEFDPRLDAYCVQAAPDALAGTRHEGRAQAWFGDGWIAFHPAEAVVIAVGGLVLAGVALRLWSRRRKAHRLG